MKDKNPRRKLIYEETARFPVDQSSLEEHRKNDCYNFNLTCSCGATFPVPLDFSGNAVICPRCSKQVKIPEADFIPMTCSCGKPIIIPRNMTGLVKKCPQCKKLIKLLENSAGQIVTEAPAGEKSASAGGTASKAKRNVRRVENIFVTIDCSCGKKNVLPLTLIGRPINCYQCHKILKLPEDNFIRIQCSCGQEFKLPRILEGKYGTCPNCRKRLKIYDNKL
jgi:hypothetical protein